MTKPNDHHHDGGRAEKQRLADRAIAALRDLADLDPIVGGLAIHVECDLQGMGYEASPNAGPDDPITPPKKP